jgi:hypothetical protein
VFTKIARPHRPKSTRTALTSCRQLELAKTSINMTRTSQLLSHHDSN